MLTLSNFTDEFKVNFTGSRIVRAIPGWTERGPECRALPRTAGSLAASRHLRGVVPMATGDVAHAVGEGEDNVKEIH